LRLALDRRAAVTGCAGFVGSHLCERLVDEGWDVIGVDCFTPYYDREAKERNLVRLREEPEFSLLEIDLVTDPLEGLLDGVDAVFHVAGQPGVRGSFGSGFGVYVDNNVLATQRLLEEAARADVGVLVYASSSSVYGDARQVPTTERTPPRPVSPYGLTKLAGEQLAGVYLRSMGVPVVSLRYFTAYGPRQRPDMAFSRFLSRALSGRPLPVNGDGRQVREFTYVADIVEATRAAATLGRPGAVYNVGGAGPVELLDAIGIIAELTGRAVEIEHRPAPPGEARRTVCDATLARRDLRFAPRTGLREGLAAQLAWMLEDQRPAAVRRGKAVAA
jgi:nucleoside-diphosphate-sugar epimerase